MYKARNPGIYFLQGEITRRTKVGLATYRIHDMRHSAASNFITKGGADILAVSQLLGHSDVRQSARYAHLTSSHLADIVERTEQKG